jgi:protein-L-isoaspartate(D-aspartate) O-methyltransferase
VNKIDVTVLRNNLLRRLRQQGVLTSSLITEAFTRVERHMFVPDVPVSDAYADRAIMLKRDKQGVVVSSISQPTMIAIMLNQLDLKRGDNVLEIGTASGYNAALMQTIVGDTGRVTSIEIDGDLVENARQILSRSHFSNVLVVHADGSGGYAPRAAYDHIVSTASIWDVPSAWINQLKLDGRIVAPIWVDGLQFSAVLRLQPDGTLYSDDNRPCAFVHLRGEGATPRFGQQIGHTSLSIYADDVNTVDSVALDVLLRSDQAINHLDARLRKPDYWFGFQIYLMLNTPDDYQFIAYSVTDDTQAYGLHGRGLGLLTPGSAVFAPYAENGVLYTFGGADAALALQELFDQWQSIERPNVNNLHIQMYPKDALPADIAQGRVYQRRHHALHVWLDTENA